MPRKARARERIQQAALELFARKGIAGTTVGDIARRAGCSQGAIYKHWESKDALGQALFESSHARLLGQMQEEKGRWSQASERIIGALLGFVRHARSHPEEHAFLFQVFHSEYSRWLAGHLKPSDILVKEIELAIKADAVPQGDPVVKTALLLGMAIRIVQFERQRLILASPEVVEGELVDAAAGVLGV